MYQSKKDLLEKVLNVSLTPEQEDVIYKGWNAFWEDPEAFNNDVVVDMVLLDLGLSPNPKVEKKVEDNQMDIRSELVLVDEIVIKHSVQDLSLVWGKFLDTRFYARKFSKESIILPKLKYIVGSLPTNTYPTVILVYENSDSYLMYVLDMKALHEAGKERISVEDIKPYGYDFLGYNFMDDGVSENSKDVMELTALVYVPFNNGSGESKIPVMWRVPELTAADYIISQKEFDEIVTNFSSGTYINLDAIKDIFNGIENALIPVIDPESDIVGERYGTLMVKTGAGDYCFGYNKNHVAHNGNIDSMKKIMGIVLLKLLSMFDDIERSNLGKYINGLIEQDELIIGFKENEDSTEQPMTESTPVESQDKEEGSTKKFSDNPLIRAAQRADITYK